jgi:hypothetical protein
MEKDRFISYRKGIKLDSVVVPFSMSRSNVTVGAFSLNVTMDSSPTSRGSGFEPRPRDTLSRGILVFSWQLSGKSWDGALKHVRAVFSYVLPSLRSPCNSAPSLPKHY